MNPQGTGTGASPGASRENWLVAVPLALAGLGLSAVGLLSMGAFALVWWRGRSVGGSGHSTYFMMSGTEVPAWVVVGALAGLLLIGLMLIGGALLVLQPRERRG